MEQNTRSIISKSSAIIQKQDCVASTCDLRLLYIKDFSAFSNCVLCHSDLVRRLIQACETINRRKRKFLSLGSERRRDVRVIPHFFPGGAKLDCSTNIEELAIILARVSSRSLHWLVNWKIKRCTLDWTSTRWR